MINKNDFKIGTKFTTKHSKNTIFTICDKSITTDILFQNKKSAITANQYGLKSITNKYLKMWDIQWGQEKTYSVKLEDIKIINITYNIL